MRRQPAARSGLVSSRAYGNFESHDLTSLSKHRLSTRCKNTTFHRNCSDSDASVYAGNSDFKPRLRSSYRQPRVQNNFQRAGSVVSHFFLFLERHRFLRLFAGLAWNPSRCPFRLAMLDLDPPGASPFCASYSQSKDAQPRKMFLLAELLLMSIQTEPQLTKCRQNAVVWIHTAGWHHLGPSRNCRSP